MCNIIHTDLKPENALVCLTPEELKEIALTGHLSNVKQTQAQRNPQPEEQSVISSRPSLATNLNRKQRRQQKKKIQKRRRREEVRDVHGENSEKPTDPSTSRPEAGKSEEEKGDKKEVKRGPKIDERVRMKICDMGNGCWTHHHFSSEIQTRQYRSPEVTERF